MIEVSIYRNDRGSIFKYIVSGHANYVRMPRLAKLVTRIFTRSDSNAGLDTICASVSSIAQSTLVGLTEVLELRPGIEIEDGYLECVIPDGIPQNTEDKVQLLLETMYLSLRSIEEQYSNFVTVNEMEV